MSDEAGSVATSVTHSATFRMASSSLAGFRNGAPLEQEIIALREKLETTQTELARRMGVSQPMVAKLESGRIKNPQLRTLLKAATALGARLKIELEPA